MLFFDVHTHSMCADQHVFSILNKYPNATNFSKPFSIGIHPWYIKEETVEQDLLIVSLQLQHKNCLALGECGLDKISETNFELQKAIFKKQVLLSEKYKKPLIIHCVKAHQVIIEIKKELKPTQTWVLHGFNKSIEIAKSLLKNGVVLSIGAAIIKNNKLQKVISEISLSSFVLETDAAEIEIQEVYQKIATIRNIEIEELVSIMNKNFKEIFIK
ncbi:TatD family hydrolase [Polaribacter sp. Z014]|uniref:TatD family hydrolase n=1 Tax=Polaribacter sp. Z014 TaxID=2927126 RepID=UPI0020216AFA|nr:TatD family hydrolase [Polaribacter sp. Z014]MCL7765016.1 TatD family hydrolase [Polaribacter sp. Z014]